MRISTQRHARRIAACAVVVGSMAVAGTASAVVYVYTNDFGSNSEYRQIKQTGGDRQGCSESYGSEAKTLRVEMKGKDFCQYAPPVVGDADQPDHEVIAVGRILDSTPKSAKKRAYLGVRVRVGGGTYYEFRVTPKGRKYSLTRNPAGGGSGLPIKGTSNKIGAIGSKNKLRLRVTGSDVTAFVNNQSVATFADSNPAVVKGRAVAFGIGNSKDSRKGPVGSFSSVRVGVPTP